MPNLQAAQIVNTLADVNSRVRSLMNDDNAQLYPDGSTQLLNAVKNAYTWLHGLIVKFDRATFENVITDIPYAPAVAGEEQDLAAVLPADMYMPVQVEFRLTLSETYNIVDRKGKLPSRNTEQNERPIEWERRGQSIFVNSGNMPGYLKLTYISLVPSIALVTDSIKINNAVEALAHKAAAELAGRRGQWMTMNAMIGTDGTTGNGGIGTGAKHYAAMILDHLVMDEQEIPSRGARFGEGGVDNVSNRQYNQ